MGDVEKIARVLCRQNRCDPDRLEPGDLPRVDGVLPNGDKAHFKWRDFEDTAKLIVRELAGHKTKRSRG